MQGAMGSSKDTAPGRKGGAPAGARVGTGGRGRRGPRKATPKYLRNSALYYLERYPSSSAHLRRLLLAKVTRSTRAHGTDAEEGAAAVEALIAGLLAKGVEGALIDQALAGLREEAAEPELAAALAYARRRRLGPYRSPAARAGLREKDLAALGRQGFGYDLARRVIETDDLAELEDEAGSR